MIRALTIFAVAGLALAADTNAKNCKMYPTTPNGPGTTVEATSFYCHIDFQGGCDDCSAYHDDEHNQLVLECTQRLSNGTEKVWKDACPEPLAQCNTTTNTCQMFAPYGKEINKSEITEGFLPEEFTTWDGCRLGCQLNSLCQSFTFDVQGAAQNDSKAQDCRNVTIHNHSHNCMCTWYQAATTKSKSKLIWIFNMAVQAFSFFVENGTINNGTVSPKHLVVDVNPVHNTTTSSKEKCETAYAEMWQSIKAGNASITLGDDESLIGGFASRGGMPLADEWFGIDVPLPEKFLQVSISYSKSMKSSKLQAGLNATCNGYSLVSYDDGTTYLAPDDSREARKFRWTVPQNAPGVFARLGKDGETQGVLYAKTDAPHALVVSDTSANIGLITKDYKKKISQSQVNVKTAWDWYQQNLFTGRRAGCIKEQSGKQCHWPLNGIEEGGKNNGKCDDGWQFTIDAADTGPAPSLKLAQGRCVFYKLVRPAKRLRESFSTVANQCSECNRSMRFGEFACITDGTGQNAERCNLAPSADFCEKNLAGTFCNKPTTGCHMDGTVAVASYPDGDACRIDFSHGWGGCYECKAMDDAEHHEKYIACRAKSDNTTHNAKCPPKSLYV